MPGCENQVSPIFSCRTPVLQLPYAGNVLILSYWKLPFEQLLKWNFIVFSFDCFDLSALDKLGHLPLSKGRLITALSRSAQS